MMSCVPLVEFKNVAPLHFQKGRATKPIVKRHRLILKLLERNFIYNTIIHFKFAQASSGYKSFLISPEALGCSLA